MDSKRNTIGDLDRVLCELDGIMSLETIVESKPITTLPRASVSQERRTSPRSMSPAPGQGQSIHRSPRPSLVQAPVISTVPNKQGPRVYVRPTPNNQPTEPVPQERKPVSRAASLSRQSQEYDYVIEEMGRRFSRKMEPHEYMNTNNTENYESFGGEEYVDMDEEVFDGTEDYVDMDIVQPSPLSPPSPQTSRMPVKYEQLPRLSFDSRVPNAEMQLKDVALIKLKSQTEPRRQTDPCIASAEDKNNFLRETSRKMSEQSATQKAIINFYNEDNSYKTIVVDENMTAKDVCEILIMKNRISRRVTWQIVECLQDEKLERALEDHEKVLKIYECWPMNKSYCFKFHDDRSKYMFFQNPLEYVPDHLLEKSEKEKSSRSAREKISEARDAYAKEMAFSTSRFLELEGLLWIKESGKKWKQAFSFMRSSGLYYSTKGTSKEPKYLHCLVDLAGVNIYTCTDAHTMKKVFKAPTDFLIVFKKVEEQQEPQDMICICTRSSKNQKCFQQCLLFAKFGIDLLRDNFNKAIAKHEKMRQLRAGAEFKKKKKKFEDSIQKELNSLCSEDWYFGELSRETAAEHMLRERQDGCFLVRTTYGEIYLTMFKSEKIHHFLIQAMEVELSPRFTLEEGLRNFETLSSLIEHYKSDSGSLPTCLTKPPSRKLTRYPM